MEEGAPRVLNLTEFGNNSVFVVDAWKTSFSPQVAPHVNSSLFTEVIFGREKPSAVGPLSNSPPADHVLVRFEVHSIFVSANQSVRVCGEAAALGAWDLTKAPILKDGDFPIWKVNVQIPRSAIPFRYKYVVCNEDGTSPTWENEKDRIFEGTQRDVAIISDGAFRRDVDFRGAGVAIPVFAIRTEGSLGVGEFSDIKPLADWADQCGLRLIQILPINDTSVRGDWRDSYPYSSLSVTALHPMYLRLNTLTKDKKILERIEAKRKILNGYPEIDYEAVVAFKTEITREIYKQESTKFVGSEDFKAWFSENELWLTPYALFCVMRDKYETSDFAKWEEHKSISKTQIRELASPKSKLYDQVCYYYYLQWNLHLQLKEASEYAKSKGVGLKGDIAIGVNPKSVDTWVFPELFRLDKQTGAPPDFFADDGQNWGFPTYNWEEMAKDDFAWWRSRLTRMSQYFHAFRIDHILGFFRIWEIPGNAVTGLLGRFYPSVPVTKGELDANNLWDVERLVEPYIRTHQLWNLFGQDQVAAICERYLVDQGDNRWKFKPEYNSEKAIERALPPSKDKQEDSNNARLRKNLFRLLQNVILLRDSEDENKYYPRIEMFKTSSFLELSDWQKDKLYRIYLDYFFNRQETLWTEAAMQRLPVMVNSTKMLCCGEDLGMVPKCVAPVMEKLNILGLRIQRMTDDPKKEFWHPNEYAYLSVCTPSVHDTSTTRAWWEEDYPCTERFYKQILGMPGTPPVYCEPHIMKAIIGQHLVSRSMLAVFPIQDLFGLKFEYIEGRDPKKERINVPSNPEHYWRYRMHLSVETLLQDKKFMDELRFLIGACGRYTS
eukprot:TRINITY_DN4103_c0_g1_i1.p1 TRINITY_DN4103_c0_g1~~TRINITY_DN4103_c0_g1_i1.p1  ORF type:complete len:918 (-),score=196.07 TRINITY_DN4103_c0_g1_i1:89-2587(-)